MDRKIITAVIAVIATLAISACGGKAPESAGQKAADQAFARGSGLNDPSSGPAPAASSSAGPGDLSSFVQSTITSQFPSHYANDNSGETATISGVQCVETGATQAYTCLGSVTAGGQSRQSSFTASCNSAGTSCIWQSN